ncbi:hypothetical protein DOTSEDRAFT_68888 [Dothistroma septosporum NZE10]|uniref:DUF3074 domain-containing protein n=1 Tax=Dothistroma septosporum (strain NZE10 / CBS 128990) TaxID=675120 RepID=N1Q558_DOTSN|nr:hypothetical protein DOTSEDRAFT_68888 [Dothistroma septosporum NZE10]
MLREFPQSLSVKGGPGAGAVRGLAADRRLEQIDVKGVGRLEVYLLSSVFPGPVTPRDFVTLLLSSDGVLSDKSAAELEGGKRHVPRHFMLISKPVQHPDAPARSGLVRGQYESVELIREIPITPAKSKCNPNLSSTNGAQEQHSRERGPTVGTADTEGASALDQHVNVPASFGEGDPELNPVEWIMITRSDPGGGLPRFLVERGTPEPMIGDVHKFFDWACSLNHMSRPDEDLGEQVSGAETAKHVEDQVPSQSTQTPNGDNQQDSKTAPPNQSPAAPVSRPDSQGGIINNITKAIGTGIETYAPAAVADRVGPYLNSGEADLSDDSSDTSSVDSFMSAEELRRMSTAPEQPTRPIDSTDVLSIASADLSDLPKDTKDMGHHEKEVYKITQKREKLEQQLARKRMEQEQKLKQTQEKEESETTKQREEMEKKLKKTEDKHRRELEKLEHKKAKELRKVEEKRRKKDEQHKLSLVTRERDEFRSQVDLHRRENTLLQEQVADLQRQNTLMAQKLQPEALQSVKEEYGRNRKGSMKSVNSAASGRSM